MAMTHDRASRRQVLAALATLPAIAALPAYTPAEAETEAPDEEGDRYQHGYDSGKQIATLYMARAWIDRWRAAGGNFGIAFNPDGSFRSLMRGRAESYTWTPTDEGNEALEPHTWLLEEPHQPGAIKVLEGLLTLVPGLQDAVTEIVGYQLLASPTLEA